MRRGGENGTFRRFSCCASVKRSSLTYGGRIICHSAIRNDSSAIWRSGKGIAATISATHPTRYGARPLRVRSRCNRENSAYRAWRKKQRKAIERKTLGSGLNAGNIGAEIDVIKPALPAQTHAEAVPGAGSCPDPCLYPLVKKFKRI